MMCVTIGVRNCALRSDNLAVAACFFVGRPSDSVGTIAETIDTPRPAAQPTLIPSICVSSQLAAFLIMSIEGRHGLVFENSYMTNQSIEVCFFYVRLLLKIGVFF